MSKKQFCHTSIFPSHVCVLHTNKHRLEFQRKCYITHIKCFSVLLIQEYLSLSDKIALSPFAFARAFVSGQRNEHPSLLSSWGSDGHRKKVIFEWSCRIKISTNEISFSDSCKSSYFVIEVIKSHDDATVNASLSLVTKQLHDKETVSDWLSKNN